MLYNEARELLVQGYEVTRDTEGIAKAYSVSKWAVYRLAEQKRKIGSVALRTSQRDRKPVLTLVFLDESGVNTNLTRLYGRALSSQRAVDHAPLNTPQTTTVLSSIRLNGEKAFTMY